MKIPAELIEAFAKRRVTVFVGAGLSRGANLPDWNELMQPLKDKIDDCPGDLSPLDIAQFYCNQHSSAALLRYLVEILDRDDVEPTDAHRIIIDLPVDRIYTTNFDSLLEKACTNWGRKLQPIFTAGALATASSNHLQIIKLHGDFRLPESVIITAEDFEEYFTTNPVFADTLAHDFRVNTMLFLGYSFNDPDVRTLLRVIRRHVGKFARKHFIVLLGPKGAVVKELERRGLSVIALDAGGNLTFTLVAWLRELDHVARGANPAATHNLPRVSMDLVGRAKEHQTVMQALVDHGIVVISGPPGIGKTRLAIKAAYACAQRERPYRFEYVVWFTARDRVPETLWLNELLNVAATTLRAPLIAQAPASEIEAKKVGVTTLLEVLPTLLVLDNFDTMSERNLCKWLESVPAKSRVLITTRTAGVAGFRGAYPVPLDGLWGADALLLIERYATERDAANAFAGRGEPAILGLADATRGNPQAIKLAVGIIEGGGATFDALVRRLNALDGNIDEIFAQLFEISWKMLSADAERLVLVSTLFVGIGSIRQELLENVAGLDTRFAGALELVLRLGLLDLATDDKRYVIHSKTRALAVDILKRRPEVEKEARLRCARYYYQFVRDVAVRKTPDVRYWDALTTKNMAALDREWPMLREQVEWAMENDSKLLVDFVMLLVHYLDSRFLNLERLAYVCHAVEFLRASRRDDSAALIDEATLRIDALGWTYVEESNLDEAYAEIERGYNIAKVLPAHERTDLVGLANAWRGRVRVEQQREADANELIDQALADRALCRPWIKMRINMSAGDIALKQHRYEDALMYYECAADEASKYEGDGESYQIDPRIGLVLISLGQLDEAEKRFHAAKDPNAVSIGNLYGDYGLALVKHKRGDVDEAAALVAKARQQFKRRQRSNLLWTLLNDLYERLSRSA